MKKFTTSAQKTLSLSKDVILEKLENEMSKNTDIIFKETKTKNIKEAKMKDGSKMIIAAFNKPNGKTLAMIDYKDVPVSMDRNEIQSDLKQKLASIFNGGQ